jgi:branched-chain amino acid transport system permease protein
VTIYTEYHGLVLGTVILLIVLGLRRGLADYLHDWLRQRRLASAASAAAIASAASTTSAAAPVPATLVKSRKM